tara:strand:+ start:9301 stop:9933 length:633 start_codon:yes stop_codon:yes gene_type:complete
MIYGAEEEKEEEPSEECPSHIDPICQGLDGEDPPLLGLVGEITEEGAQQITLALLTLNGGKILHTDPEVFEGVEDIEFFISSSGGSVNDMFSIYDLMQLIKKNRDIATFGYGKIYSAAVPLLAAGTKGKRYIGRHTRVMLHYCATNASGSHPNIRSNFDELKKVEEMMIEILSEHSNLSPDDIYDIISRNTDEFFSAEDALEMGIVDQII